MLLSTHGVSLNSKGASQKGKLQFFAQSRTLIFAALANNRHFLALAAAVIAAGHSVPLSRPSSC